MSSPAPTRFVVRRLHWSPDYTGTLGRDPGDTPVASFATPDEAEADRRRREAEVRATVNPFACGPALHYLTHFDEPRLRDWLQDRGVDPPAADPKTGTTDWAGWWKKGHKKLSAERRAAVWDALHKVRFFTAGEEPDRPVGYAVLQINWEYNDETYDAYPGTDRVLTVFRSRAGAEVECARRNQAARRGWAYGYPGPDPDDGDLDDNDWTMFDMREKVRRREGVLSPDGQTAARATFRSPASAPFFEVVEVPLEGL